MGYDLIVTIRELNFKDCPLAKSLLAVACRPTKASPTAKPYSSSKQSPEMRKLQSDVFVRDDGATSRGRPKQLAADYRIVVTVTVKVHCDEQVLDVCFASRGA